MRNPTSVFRLMPAIAIAGILATFGAGPVSATSATSPATASAASAGETTKTFPMTADECSRVLASKPGTPCVVTVTMSHGTGTTSGATAASSANAATGQSCYGWVVSNWFESTYSAGVWATKIHITYNDDLICGNVEYTSVTCQTTYSIGWSIKYD